MQEQNHNCTTAIEQPTTTDKYQPTTNTTNNNTIAIDTAPSTNTSEDELFNQLLDKGLTNETFRSWYCGKFHELGREYSLALAGKALVEGNNPQRYFSYLLKNATENRG